MANRDLHPDIAAFVDSLARLEEILNQHEGGHWSEKISRIRGIAERSDGYSIVLFLGLFGGMGSFSDLDLNAPKPANDAFRQARARAYKLAKALE